MYAISFLKTIVFSITFNKKNQNKSFDIWIEDLRSNSNIFYENMLKHICLEFFLKNNWLPLLKKKSLK